MSKLKKYVSIVGLLLLALLAHAGGGNNTPLAYPKAEKVTQTDNYFGTLVADPYRWMENDTSARVKQWVDAENKVTQDYLAQIPFREGIKKRLTEIWNYERFSSPFREGEYYYFSKNDGLQNQSVIYYQKGLNGKPEVFIDPNTMSPDGTTHVSLNGFSKDKKYVAYSVHQSGSDWSIIYVMEVATRQLLADKIQWVKNTGVSWYGNGFYYSGYAKPAGSEFTSKNQFQKVYYHRLGDSQDKDEIVYEDKANPLRYHGAYTTDDDRFLIVYISEGTYGNQLMVRDLKEKGELVTLAQGFKNQYGIVDNVGDKLIMKTDDGAPNEKVVLVDPKKPGKENWQLMIPEKEYPIESVSSAGGKLFVTYLRDVSSRVYQLDMQAKLETEIVLPGFGIASGFGGYKEDTILFYSFTSYIYPPVIYQYNVRTKTSEVWKKSDVKFNPADYETKQVFYTSKDSTKVPMFLTSKKGLPLNGNNPTLLYGYGGFNISSKPTFNVSNLVLLENGGIFAVANLRGGGEYGDKWHKAGMLLNKQNVFDDFIAAAEYLIKEKYTSSERLAISGRSNGGLLVGACMTQRPGLFKVAFPAVGVMDMLRYHKFTIGWGWAVEYGSSDSAAHFKNLYRYSPLHNIKERSNWPATMVTTGDHDDRVVPAHSFKFAATLQENNKGTSPTLIRIDTKAGHGAGKPTTKLIDEQTDIWSFMFYNVGVVPKY